MFVELSRSLRHRLRLGCSCLQRALSGRELLRGSLLGLASSAERISSCGFLIFNKFRASSQLPLALSSCGRRGPARK